VNAGQPNLDGLSGEIIPDPEDVELEKAVKSGKMKGREEHGKD
jgi:uncharacterized protein (UPF0210 family)